HGVVAFVAGILVHGFVTPVHRLLGPPGLRVVDRILDGEFVMDLLVADAAELFDYLALRAEDDLALTGLLGMDVHRLDHQRVALPPADGIAQPRLDGVGLVLRVGLAGGDRNDAGVVDHLHDDDDVVLRLHDLVVVVVDGVEHPRPARAGKADQAAFGDGQSLRAFVQGFTPFRAGLGARLLAGGRDGDAAVRGIDQPGRAEFTLYRRELDARIDPEGVVATVVVLVFQKPVLEVRGALLALRKQNPRIVLQQLPGLFRGDRELHVRSTRETGQRLVGPDALEVWL